MNAIDLLTLSSTMWLQPHSVSHYTKLVTTGEGRCKDGQVDLKLCSVAWLTFQRLAPAERHGNRSWGTSPAAYDTGSLLHSELQVTCYPPTRSQLQRNYFCVTVFDTVPSSGLFTLRSLLYSRFILHLLFKPVMHTSGTDWCRLCTTAASTAASTL